jgi:uncharacterized membrane protein YqiK
MDIMLIAAAIGVVVLFGALAMFARFYHKVEQGHAMIINTLRAEPDVSFTGGMVYPIIHKKELMEISLKTIEIERLGKDGLICRDNIRADIKVTFFLRVNKTKEDVLKVAQAVGCARASSQETLENLFSAKFAEALKTVGKSMDFVDLYQARDRFRDDIIRQIGSDLSGYILEDAAIDYLEQTSIEKLDSHNILDAQGIKKITELTAIESIRTNELKRDEEMRIKKKDVETREAILELERQQADAEARQNREVTSPRAGRSREGAVRRTRQVRTGPPAGRTGRAGAAGKHHAREGSGGEQPQARRRHRGRARHPSPHAGGGRAREGSRTAAHR